MSIKLEDLALASPAELGRLFARGAAPDIDALVGYEFRGFNVGRGPAMLRIQKFIKGFFRGPDHVEGYNIRVVQNGLGRPWVEKPGLETPERFGFFVVTPHSHGDGPADNRHGSAALLDYGASPRNPRWRIERLLRDYLVVPDPDRPDILLGKAYLAMGGVRVPAAYFLIKRLRPTSWQP